MMAVAVERLILRKRLGEKSGAVAASPNLRLGRQRPHAASLPNAGERQATLASLIDVINTTREEHIMTIEDPIEFLHRHKKCMVTSVRSDPMPSPLPMRLGRRCAKTPT